MSDMNLDSSESLNNSDDYLERDATHPGMEENNDFQIPSTFFEKFKVDNHHALSKGWIRYFKSHFKSINPDCDISFEYNKCLKGLGPLRRIWCAAAHCTKSGFAKYKFSINANDVVEGSKLTVHTEITGLILNHQAANISSNVEGINTSKRKRPTVDYANNIFTSVNNNDRFQETDSICEENGYFTLKIPSTFWTNYHKDKSQERLLRGWTDDLNNYFALNNDFCVLAFKSKKCLKTVGKDGRIWYAKARCMHTGCATFEFSKILPLNKDNEIIVHVERKGFYSHDNEVR